MTLSTKISSYLRRRQAPGPWCLEGDSGNSFRGAIVIPALAEEQHLGATLASLAANPAPYREDFLVVVVVNQRPDAAEADKADNQKTLLRLATRDYPAGLRLAWVDAAGSGRELPPGQGVGLARKIGCDLALARLAPDRDPLLVFLDADTLVQADYLPTLDEHFRQHAEGGAVLPFQHQPGETLAQQQAIDRYELFLRSYVLGLERAGSPYAYHSIGSTIACRASAYLKAGGMNRRLAGEDFYFLEQLAKTSGLAPLKGTRVFPAARPSHRVPFGTGEKVQRLMSGEEQAVTFYPVACFQILETWLRLVAKGLREEGEGLLARLSLSSPEAAGFLRAQGFVAAWRNLQRNHPEDRALHRAFHGWFDALRTLRFIHHLCAGPCPRQTAEKVIPALFSWAGGPHADKIGRQLALMRAHQSGEASTIAALPVIPGPSQAQGCSHG